MDDSLDELDGVGLARLLRLQTRATWTDADTATALRRQLESPVVPDLYLSPLMDRQKVEGILRGRKEVPTFQSCLLERSSDPALLVAIKDFAKHILDDSANPLSPGGARVLYIASIAAGILHGIFISKLSKPELSEAIRRAREQGGAEQLKQLFEKTLAVLTSP